MSRATKFLAATVLLLLPIIQACGDDVPPPPPTGSIDGLVSIEGQGADNISVSLSNGASATTANGGMFRFDGVEAGTYTVTISNYPVDATFNQTSATATIATEGQAVTVNFPGTWIRTSSIMGTVTVEDEGLGGVTVKLSGTSDSETLTDGNGQYAFSGLRAGAYTVEISGFDDEDVGFGSTSSSATVAAGESKVVSFEGTYLRTSAIIGQVTGDGDPLAGITVSLQGRGEDRSVTTNASGNYRFEQLRRGDYAVGISGYDTDEVDFDATSQNVTVAFGETTSVPFEGTLLRTAGIEGRVTIEGTGLSGVSVSISGNGETKEAVTNSAGQYAFDRLHAGDYSVVVSGYDDDEYGFDATSQTVTVALQSTATVDFDGIRLRTAAIAGEVTVGDDKTPLADVTVTVKGGPKGEEHSAVTGSDGAFAVEELHAGDYSVTISDYDEKEWGFDPTTKSVTVGLKETADVAFQGEALRTASVTGRVSVAGEGMAGLTVKLTGEEDREGKTNADGQYGFSGLAAGDYTLAISGYDEMEYSFDPASKSITLALDEWKNENFMGRSLRTAAIAGSVTVEGEGLAGIAVTLIKVISANSGEILGTKPTDSDGAYAFGDLLAGAYQVMIAGYADEHDFAAGTEWTGAAMTDQTTTVDFAATIIRTASVSGMVTVDGDAMSGVTLTLTGDHAPDDNTTMTGDDGMYEFGGLRKGDYTVTMTNPDADAYSFPTTSRSMNLSVGQKQTGISFAGEAKRRGSISGWVNAEGDAIAGVTVTLSGKADGEQTTGDNGAYNFRNLAAGTYIVEITGWSADDYDFSSVTTTRTVKLANDGTATEDFSGKHTRTASISGNLFLDEVEGDGEQADDEPNLDLSVEIKALQAAGTLPATVTGLPLMLEGPGVDDERVGMANADGSYSFSGLRKGTYYVSVDLDFAAGDLKVRDLLTAAGYYSDGKAERVDLAAAAEASVDFPFEITMQTIMAGAVMGNADKTGVPVAGVKLSMYPTDEDAANGTNMLGEATTGENGSAKFDFMRSKDLGEGGQGTDHLVFIKVADTGHDDLVVSNIGNIAVEYEAVDRVSNAPTAARLLNVGVNFQWSVMSDKDAKDGNAALEGWTAMEQASGKDGMATYSGTVTKADLPVTMTVALADEQSADVTMGEMWEQSKALTYASDGMTLPANNAAKDNDLGAIYVTFTTQKLVVGVYREADDVPGYTDRRVPGLPRGDHRPAKGVAANMTIDLLKRDDRNRLQKYEWDHDACTNEKSDETDDAQPAINIVAGIATVPCIPADAEVTVRFREGTNRTLVTSDEYIEAFGRDLEMGSTVGAFGEMGGAGPVVRVCSNSEGTDDDSCGTFGYQWMTGSVKGAVGKQSGLGIAIAATTTEYNSHTDDKKTGANGAYTFAGLQDGDYDVTATGSSEWRVVEDPTQSVTVYHDEYKDDDDDDTKYTGTADAVGPISWTTKQLGLAIMGYVGNDRDRAGDNTLRGEETMAGITLTLKKGTKTVGTATTDDAGLYAFENLEEGSYTVVANAHDDYMVFQGYDAKGKAITTEAAEAATYPNLANVGKPKKPKWNVLTNAVSNMAVVVTDDQGTSSTADDVSATMENFALVYTDGELSGMVHNVSSPRAIDVDITQCASGEGVDCPTANTNLSTEVEAGSDGAFSLANLMEGHYIAQIQDNRWSPTRMLAGKPDDDGPDNSEAATTVAGEIEGSADIASFSPLYVYDNRASTNDSLSQTTLRRVRVEYKIHSGEDNSTTYNTKDTTHLSYSGELSGASTSSDNPDGGNVSFNSRSVTVVFPHATTIPTGATATVMKHVGEAAPKACGNPCTLTYNATNATTNPGAELANNITIRVTAANGYDDHDYTFTVTQQGPVDNVLINDEITVTAISGTGASLTGSGTKSEPWNVYTGATGAVDNASAAVHFDLEDWGSLDAGNEVCAQTLVVKKGTSVQTAAASARNDVCPGERYKLSGSDSGTDYTLEVFSEDNVKKVYYLIVWKGSAG